MNFFEADEFDFPEPREVRFDGSNFHVRLEDGREIGVPLAWYPRLAKATREQLLNFELSPCGIHWAEIDEDISVKGIMLGKKSFEYKAENAA